MPFVALDRGARARRLAPVVSALTASLLLGACAGGTTVLSDAPKPEATLARADAPKSELQKATDYWGKKSAEDPTDARAAVNYAKNLKAMGAKREALVALQAAYEVNPKDRELNSEFGRLALENEQVTLAQKLLEQADDPQNPDWRVLSARGTALAKQSKHGEAIAFYERARQLAPDQASILSNLAMAHAMSGQSDRAEGLLRQASAKPDADPRVQQNLALVLGLNGKHDEAKVMGADRLPVEASSHNADMVRQLVETNGPPTDARAPVALAPVAKPAPMAKAAAPSKASKLATASVAPAAQKTKGKSTAGEAEVDATELVRRLADGDATVKR